MGAAHSASTCQLSPSFRVKSAGRTRGVGVAREYRMAMMKMLPSGRAGCTRRAAHPLPSFGIGLEDVATAGLVYTLAQQRGVGQEIEFLS